MKKTRYYPFERNRYFYGKLLTVRDFESEQKYFNDKRRMMNRLLHGAGVITGLQVIAVDDKSVSVEMGAAIDALGREIIISSPVTLKLSMMDGFTNNEYAKNVYLCIAYDEKGKEPVHSVANAAVRSDEISEYNRVLESYRLFIREEAPDPASFPLNNVMDQTSVLYQDSQVRILQSTPRYVNPGQLFEMTLRVEKTLQAAKVFFQYEVAGDQVEAESYGALTFSEPQDRQETEYEIKVLLRAGRSSKGKSRVGVKRDTAVLRIGDKQVPLAASSMNELNIINRAVKDQWLEDYVNRSLEDSLESSSEPCIYLAKINLLQMGPTYIIEKVEPVPFGEYVYNASALHKLGQNDGVSSPTDSPIVTKSSITSLGSDQEPELKVAYNRENNEISFNLGLPSVQSNQDMRTGVVEIPVASLNKFTASPFGKGGKSYVSDEIEHGLGAGDTYIVTGLEEVSDDYISDILSNSERVYYGASDVFKGSEFETSGPEVKIGTLVYPRKGTFRVGVRLQQPTEATNIRVRWWAYNKPSEVREASSAVENSVREAASGKEE
ncbi:hypothetical protein [Paenibacillus radicis (ex Xue et al. 2023)]|uniref:Uncharacterized protein n=1 Tax=Paenibacillus radicis (ex Xue et al. 2023) TaxID=2972489 RepID=A0ABT1YKS1_9BACL|nr:hypothetical protein [Paenibacillus radicis (ex Xue et al. 2023)]MCR8633783.1 hypothetical protein [Paenibacillus radicis (ex Xue et al. 2023)]